jgi:low temperature requirement protein LtrA
VVTPLQERSKFRLYALVSGLLLVTILLDLALDGSVEAPVWVFVIALLLSGVWIGGFYGGHLQVGDVASRASRRRATYAFELAVVVGSAIAVSRLLDVERTTFQVVLEVVGVGVAAFLVGLSLTVLRNLRGAPVA